MQPMAWSRCAWSAQPWPLVQHCRLAEPVHPKLLHAPQQMHKPPQPPATCKKHGHSCKVQLCRLVRPLQCVSGQSDHMHAPMGRSGTSSSVQAYMGKSKAWRGRYVLLSSYADFVADPTYGNVANESDIAALRKISRDTAWPVLERFHAQLACAHVLWCHGRREEAIRLDRRALELAAEATPEHREDKVLVALSDREKPHWVRAGECIDANVTTIQANLQEFDPSGLTPPPGRTRIPVKRGITWPVPCYTEAEAAVEEMKQARASRERSRACSHCAATDVKLSCCRKCKLAYYCSLECQRGGWKVHKPQCRSPGEHRTGDVVMLQKLQARPELNGECFVVLGPDDSKPDRWLVENVHLQGGLSLSVRSETMRHMLTH